MIIKEKKSHKATNLSYFPIKERSIILKDKHYVSLEIKASFYIEKEYKGCFVDITRKNCDKLFLIYNTSIYSEIKFKRMVGRIENKQIIMLGCNSGKGITRIIDDNVINKTYPDYIISSSGEPISLHLGSCYSSFCAVISTKAVFSEKEGLKENNEDDKKDNDCGVYINLMRTYQELESV